MTHSCASVTPSTTSSVPNMKIAKVAASKFEAHLSQEMVGLALLDSPVSEDSTKVILKAMGRQK